MDRYKLFKPIAMCSNVKPNQIQITFNIQGKTALDVYLKLTRRLMNFIVLWLCQFQAHTHHPWVFDDIWQAVGLHYGAFESSQRADGDGTLMTVTCKLKTKNYTSELLKP